MGKTFGRISNAEREKKYNRTTRSLLMWASLLVAVLIVFIFLFDASFDDLTDAIQDERVGFVREISKQNINTQQFMEDSYSGRTAFYASHINTSGLASYGELARLAASSGDALLLASPDGTITDSLGKAVVIPNRRLMEIIGGGLREQIFISVNYTEDCWLFCEPIEPIVVEGVLYNTLILAVPLAEYADSLSVSLFDNNGATYVIGRDGSISLKPESVKISFSGYNIYAGMLASGASASEIAALEADIRTNPSGEMLIMIDRENWLISHHAINADSSILVAVPLTITAASTYRGMNRVIFFSMMVVAAVAALAAMGFIYFSVRDRKRRQDELAIKAKSDFFSKMSHDIRTPLNAIIGLELLAIDSAKEPIVKDYLKKSSASATYLLSIINDVLDMNHIESGKMTIASDPFDMNGLIENISAVMKAMTTTKSLSVSIIADRFDTQYLGDQVRLQQVLVNLLSNAVKFTRTGGKVSLNVSKIPTDSNRDLLTMVVSDTGIGISPEFITHIFTPFEQERSSFTQQTPGSGLGLAIVKSLLELMGGEVAVESRIGEGSTFTVTLPLEKSDEAPAASLPSADALNHFTGCRALLAEDNMINRTVVQNILKSKFGMSVDTAENGRQAVELFASSKSGDYSIVFMDIKMPVLDGLQAAAQIRALPHPDAKTVPIVALSANAFEEDIQLSLEAGMNEHMSKPVDLLTLNSVLTNSIKVKSDKEEK